MAAQRSERGCKRSGRNPSGIGPPKPVTSEDGLEEVPDHPKMIKLRYTEPPQGPLAENPAAVILSATSMGKHLVLSPDCLSVMGVAGFKSVRASQGVRTGTWLCEATVEHLGPSGHVRLGWCTKKADPNTPIGYDCNGISYRDVDGSKVCNAERTPYGKPYVQGDVVGLYIHMGPFDPSYCLRLRTLAKWKGRWMEVVPDNQNQHSVPDSCIAFYLNGELQGVALGPLAVDTYYPGASLFSLPDQEVPVKVTFNFGPDFNFPPAAGDSTPPWRPLSDLAVEEHAQLLSAYRQQKAEADAACKEEQQDAFAAPADPADMVVVKQEAVCDHAAVEVAHTEPAADAMDG